jgi:hypothetical protein
MAAKTIVIGPADSEAADDQVQIEAGLASSSPSASNSSSGREQ